MHTRLHTHCLTTACKTKETNDISWVFFYIIVVPHKLNFDILFLTATLKFGY